MPLDRIAVLLTNLGVNTPVGIDGTRVATVSDWLKKASARGSTNPGRALQLALGEIFLANMDAHTIWGWADHRNTEVLDFLREFDDQIRFLLVVESPQELLARITLAEKITNDGAREEALSKWCESVEALLRFNRAWPEITLLTNSVAWAFDEKSTLSQTAQWLDLSFDGNAANTNTRSREDPARLLLARLTPIPEADYQEVNLLWQEVLALSPSPDERQLDEACASLVLKLIGNTLRLETSARDLASEKARPRNDPRLEAELQDVKEENDLILSQLHQVQEELERYFLMYKESEENLRKANVQIKKQRRQLRRPAGRKGPHWEYDDIRLVRYMVEPSYESIWVALEGACFGDRKWPRYEFRLGAANVKDRGFSRQPHYEFPRMSGDQQAFENWSVESSDEVRGERFELRFNLADGAMDLAAWKQLSDNDRLQLASLMVEMPLILDDLAEEVSAPSRGWEPWKQLNQDAVMLLGALLKK